VKEYPVTLTPIISTAGGSHHEIEHTYGMQRNGAMPSCKSSKACITAKFQGNPSSKQYWDTVLNSPSTHEPDMSHNRPRFPPQELNQHSNSFHSTSQHGVNRDRSLESSSSSTCLDSARMVANSSSKYLGCRLKYQSRKFKCHICPLECERKGHLEQHILAVHNHMKQFHCPFGCTKPFGHRSSLARHIKNVHGTLIDSFPLEQRSILVPLDPLDRMKHNNDTSK
jgi:hypothetical protein